MALLGPRRTAFISSLRSSYVGFLCTLAASVKQIAAPLVDDDPTFGTPRVEPPAPRPDFDDDDEDTDAEDHNTNPKWKKLVGPECQIYHGHIPRSAWHVLQRLNQRGFATYLVGGCIRDALLKQIPKDYDVITNAQLTEIKSMFDRSVIVGKQFPVCHVTGYGDTVEVSSFSTVSNNPGRKARYINFSAQDCHEKGDIHRCENAMHRDFTINSFLYDPFERILYDYVGGLQDLEKKKIRTVIPPHQSFSEDPARLLRGLRIAARLNFRFSRETSRAVKAFKYRLIEINQARLMLELNTMMAYGAAANSLRLLWKYEYLEVMLPAQAAYLQRCKLKRSSKPRRNLLTDLLTVLDKFVSPDKPCHQTLWVMVLALQLALEEKRSHLGVTTALLAIRHQNMNAAFKDLPRFENMLKTGEMTINEAYMERSLGADEDNTIIAEALHVIEDAVRGLQKMHGHPDDEPSTYGTLISRTIYAKVMKLFQGARDRVRKESLYNKRSLSENMRSRAFVEGADSEVVHAVSCVFLNTLYLPTQKNVFLFR